jgi:alpha-beta hydrolase superfamily lysophospholipase
VSKITLGPEFKKIVELLPELESAPSIANIRDDKQLSYELKILLASYLKYYGLPSKSKDAIALTIGKFKAFDFDVVAQIYQSTELKLSECKGCVVFIHGYLDHFGLYKDLINLLIKNQYIIVGIDLPGHGLSSGKWGHIVDFGQYAYSIEVLSDIIKNKYKDFNFPYYLAGFSAGAAIGLEYLFRNSNNLIYSKALWLAPLLRIPGWRYIELVCRIWPFLRYVPRQSKNTSHDGGFVTFIRFNDPMQSKFIPIPWIQALHHWVSRLPKHSPLDIKTCIIQGTNDKTIDWKNNILELARIYANMQVHYVPDGYHNICNELDRYRQPAFNYILDFFNT